jgi:hypothetical protein
MKLGTQTASVTNHLYARAVIGQPEPVAGMGATILMWTDRQAATVFRVFKAGAAVIIETRDDKQTVISGSSHDGSAEWGFKTNVRGSARYFRRASNGMWQAVRKNEATGRWIKTNGNGLRLGERDTYRDPSF